MIDDNLGLFGIVFRVGELAVGCDLDAEYIIATEGDFEVKSRIGYERVLAGSRPFLNLND